MIKNFIPLVFGATIAANIIWVIMLSPSSATYGSSGLVFAILGIAIGFLLVNIINVTSKFKTPQFTRKRKINAMISNVIPSAFLLILIIFNRFLSNVFS